MRTVAVALTVAVVSALHLRPAETEVSTEPGPPIFYMTAMAKLANKHQTRLWLESLRHNGKWMGDVVIITDKPECLAQNLGEGLLGGAKVSEKGELAIYPGGEGMGKIYMVKKPSTKNVKRMKQEKALAWVNTREIGLNPSMIVYTDQDIVFGQDLSPVMKEVSALEKGYTMALFKDQGVSSGQLHTGIIFLFPGADTDVCLATWAKKILSEASSKYHGFAEELPQAVVGPTLEKATSDEAFETMSDAAFEAMTEEQREQFEAEMMGPDQKALGSTKSCKAGKGIYKLNKDYLMMPKGGSLASGRTATFIHFTNTNRWKSIKSAAKKKFFTEVLGLPEMDYDGYQTCDA